MRLASPAGVLTAHAVHEVITGRDTPPAAAALWIVAAVLADHTLDRCHARPLQPITVTRPRRAALLENLRFITRT